MIYPVQSVFAFLFSMATALTKPFSLRKLTKASIWWPEPGCSRVQLKSLNYSDHTDQAEPQSRHLCSAINCEQKEITK